MPNLSRPRALVWFSLIMVPVMYRLLQMNGTLNDLPCAACWLSEALKSWLMSFVEKLAPPALGV